MWLNRTHDPKYSQETVEQSLYLLQCTQCEHFLGTVSGNEVTSTIPTKCIEEEKLLFIEPVGLLDYTLERNLSSN